MKTRQLSPRRRRSFCARTVITIAILGLLGSSQKVLAQWNTSGTNINNTNTGNVGVGTTNPNRAKLEISKDSSYNMAGGLEINAGGIDTGLAIGADATNNIAWIQSLEPGVSFTTRPLVLQPNGGNVGIGTTTPSTKLHVIGDVTVSGNIAAKYQDVAEWVPAAQALPAGTVVSLNRTQSNLVEASSKAYDTRVAGVISERPGIALGERGENKVLVATTGRVKIKVDATKAPIEIGDLLVTSDKKGVAMKSIPVDMGGVQIHRPGTIIGKALEPLQKGIGEILVLLSLQ